MVVLVIVVIVVLVVLVVLVVWRLGVQPGWDRVPE